jgi:hypothetical protein
MRLTLHYKLRSLLENLIRGCLSKVLSQYFVNNVEHRLWVFGAETGYVFPFGDYILVIIALVQLFCKNINVSLGPEIICSLFNQTMGSVPVLKFPLRRTGLPIIIQVPNDPMIPLSENWVPPKIAIN